MRTLYRLVYKNGDHGAWDDDIDRIRKYAKFFHAEIEIKNDGGLFWNCTERSNHRANKKA